MAGPRRGGGGLNGCATKEAKGLSGWATKKRIFFFRLPLQIWKTEEKKIKRLEIFGLNCDNFLILNFLWTIERRELKRGKVVCPNFGHPALT